jgi:zinc protease
MRRHIALLSALLLIGSACTGSSTTTPTTQDSPTTASAPTTTTPPTTVTTVTDPEMPTWPDDDEPLPTDDDVIVGTLDNGLTYYIRENQAPGGRAQLRLAIQAGSVQEDPSQHGAAHYLEHMAFNGTESFPANELVKVLQRFGAEFGADINAYTAYDETVYTLELPTDDPDTVAAGFDVLYEWAVAITLSKGSPSRACATSTRPGTEPTRWRSSPSATSGPRTSKPSSSSGSMTSNRPPSHMRFRHRTPRSPPSHRS